MKYILKVKKLGETLPESISTTISTDPQNVLKLLAECFREVNKKTRKNSKIIKAEFWPAMDANGDEIQRFRFRLRYDENNDYLYIYSFEGCGL